MWAAIPPKRWFKVFWCLPARRSVWSSKWMTCKLCKRTCKKIVWLNRSTLLNRVVREAATNQKPPAVAAEEKKRERKPSGGVNGYLLIGIIGLAVFALGVYYQREAIMANPGSQRKWGAWDGAKAKAKAKAKTKPQSPLNGFKFFHIIYTDVRQQTYENCSYNAQCFMAGGKFIVGL